LEALFCFGLVVLSWMKQKSSAFFSVGTLFVVLHGINRVLAVPLCGYWFFGSESDSLYTALLMVNDIGFIGCYTGIFLLALFFHQLSLPPAKSSDELRRRTFVRRSTFAAAFAFWVVVDIVIDALHWDTHTVKGARIAGECLFSGVPLFWGWRRLRVRMIEREQSLAATVQRMEAISKIRTVVVAGVVLLFIKMIIYVITAPHDFFDIDELEMAIVYSMSNVLPFCILVLFVVVGVRTGMPRSEGDVAVPLVSMA